MPYGDGTGPGGRGGYCTDLLKEKRIDAPLKRGFFGRGRGFRQGRGIGRDAPELEEYEISDNYKKRIDYEVSYLEARLNDAKKRLSEVEK